MKNLFIAVFLALASAASADAQSSLLDSYYAIKNSLVNSDAAGASVNATGFIKAADSIEMTPVKSKLIEDAKLIATAKDLSRQRDYFAGFSQDLYSFLKTAKVSREPVYKMYCPMKKTIWVSNEKEIRNPYFGKVMLTCGSVTETINP